MATATKQRGYQIVRERPDLWMAHCGHPKHAAHTGTSEAAAEESVRYHMKVHHPEVGTVGPRHQWVVSVHPGAHRGYCGCGFATEIVQRRYLAVMDVNAHAATEHKRTGTASVVRMPLLQCWWTGCDLLTRERLPEGPLNPGPIPMCEAHQAMVNARRN